MLVLLVDAVESLVGFLTDLSVLRLDQSDIVTVAELKFISIFVMHHWKDDIRIIQDSKGFARCPKDFTSTSQKLLFTLCQNVSFLFQKLVKIMLIQLQGWLLS